MIGYRYLSGVATLSLAEDKCNGCGVCTQVCPHAVLALEGRKARIVDKDACMECGACALNCAPEALSVRSGVGCANALFNAKIRGQDEATCCCGPDTEQDSGCCC